ncbi:MAG: hypothetical protein JO287_17175 [Pseudonocardiales bacterium]|nr:hypothetical protein [Pseudonocardiales bacterium]
MPIAEVYALADAIDQRYRALVLLGTSTSLRWAEHAALHPKTSTWNLHDPGRPAAHRGARRRAGLRAAQVHSRTAHRAIP